MEAIKPFFHYLAIPAIVLLALEFVILLVYFIRSFRQKGDSRRLLDRMAREDARRKGLQPDAPLSADAQPPAEEAASPAQPATAAERKHEDA